MFMVLLLYTMVLTSNANNCFEPCVIKTYGASGTPQVHDATIGGAKSFGIFGLPLTNYHCILQCANKITYQTVGYVMPEGSNYNRECVLIDNLDYCVQLWKQLNDVNCEEDIYSMVLETFQVCTQDLKNIKSLKNIHFRMSRLASKITSRATTNLSTKMLH